MRTEPGIRGRPLLRLLCLGLAGIALPGVAWAGPWFGHLQVQYQSVDRDVLVIAPDSSTSNRTFTRSWWVQNYELNYTNLFRNRMQLLAQARFTDISVNGRKERQTIPEGSLRLNHPYYGFTGRYRPITISATANTPDFGAEIEQSGQPPLEIETRNTELTFTAFAAPPKLPRLDLSWLKRTHTTSQTEVVEEGITRNARLNYEVGRLGLRAEAGNISSSSPSRGGNRVIQNSWGAGGAFAVWQRPGQALNIRYDIVQLHRLPGDPGSVTTTSHTAGANGFLHVSRTVTGSLQYSLRRSDVSAQGARELTQQDGALQVQYVPRPSIRISGATGVRSLPRGLGQVAQQYLMGSAAAQGKVLPGWEGEASFSHVTNWTPGEPNYSIESLRGGSTFILARGLEVLGDITFTENGNPITQAIGSVILANAGLRVSPWRRVSFDYRYGIYRAGPSFTDIFRRSRNWKFGFNWQLAEPLRFSVDVSRTGTLPNNDPDIRTEAVRLNWTPSRMVQLTALYSKSDRVFLDPTASRLVGTEIASLRWVSGVGRSWVFSANLSVTNPGESLQARQLDAALTYSFGR